jgi:PAS domain S-box-containing protein
MNPYALISLFVAVFNLSVGLFILFRRPEATVNRRFFLLSIPLTFWPICEFLLRMTSDALSALVLSKACWAFVGLIPAALVYFALGFTKENENRTRARIISSVFFIISALFCVSIFTTGGIVKTVTRKFWGYAGVTGGPLYWLFIFYYITSQIGVILFILRSFRKTQRRLKRIQTIYAALAVSAPVIIGNISQVFLPLFGLEIVPLASPSTVLATGIIALAVIKFKFIIVTPNAAADAILETIPDSLIILDRDCKLVMVNKATCTLFSRLEEELIGLSLVDILALDKRTGMTVKELIEKISKSSISSLDIQYVLMDGRRIPMILSSTPITDDSGEISGIACVAKDVTMLRKSIKNLEQTHDQLTNEMELAKQIQTSILPPSPHVPGYQTAAVMLPANEVGGDFYEFITIKDVTWIAIGDVSGHGVTPGLIMMMVQSAMQSAITLNPSITPSELFITMNSVIRNNIDRLHEDKYMTISILRLEKDGSFTMVGKHQDILVFRTGRNLLETISTDGVWLGMTDDITGFTPENKIVLSEGDVMMLYTDGLSEARNLNGEMFEEQMHQQFLRYAEEDPEKAARNITGSCLNYMEEQVDDISLIILKKE